MEFHAKLALLGLVAGTIGASTGIGWGLITVPMLLLVLQVPPKEAVSLSVLASVGYLISLVAYRYTYGGVAWSATLVLTPGKPSGRACWRRHCGFDPGAHREANYRRHDDHRWPGVAHPLERLSQDALCCVRGLCDRAQLSAG
jgi:sulfite exporter TauE/SafE